MSLRQFVLITKEMCLVLQTVWIRYSTEKYLGEKNRRDQNPIVIWGVEGRVGGLPFKKGRGAYYLIGVKKAVLLPLYVSVFSLKRSTAGAFVIPFRVSSQFKRIWYEILCYFRIGTSQG